MRSFFWLALFCKKKGDLWPTEIEEKLFKLLYIEWSLIWYSDMANNGSFFLSPAKMILNKLVKIIACENFSFFYIPNLFFELKCYP